MIIGIFVVARFLEWFIPDAVVHPWFGDLQETAKATLDGEPVHTDRVVCENPGIERTCCLGSEGEHSEQDAACDEHVHVISADG